MADRASNRAEQNSSFARAGARRRPRAWAAPIARPAARIAVAGGLTLAGWLLGAALSQANAATDDHVDRPAVSAHDPEPEHRYAGTATSGTLTWAMPGAATGAKRTHLHRSRVAADDNRPDASSRPTAVAGSDPDTRPHSPGQHDSQPAGKTTKPAKPENSGKAEDHAPASAATIRPGSVSEPEQGFLSSTSHETGLIGGTTSKTAPSLFSTTSHRPESLGNATSTPRPNLLSTTSHRPESLGNATSTPRPNLLSTTSHRPESLGNATTKSRPNLLSSTSHEAGLLGGLLGSTTSKPAPNLLSSTSYKPGLLGGLLGGSDLESGPGLLGGLLGSPETSAPGFLDGILGTVDTALHTTVTSVDTMLDTAPVRVVALPVDTVEPAPSTSGAVSASVPVTKLVKEPDASVAVQVSKQAPVAHTAPARVLTAQSATKQDSEPASPVKEHSQAGGGSSGGGGEGIPSAPAAPAAPASTVAPGHDGSGGLRHLFALASDGDTATQLKLIGVSRDHEVDGAGRDAVLPTTSPD